MGALSRLLRPKMKLFAVEFRRIWKFLPYEVYEESSWRIIMIYASKNGSSPLARFTKILGAFYFHDLCPKTKLFAMTFRCILKVLCLQVLQKKLLVHYHDLCVQR